MGERSAPRVEANVFSIENLGDLSSWYRLYRIKGLYPEHTEYYQNRQAIVRKLSYQLRNPVTIVDRDDKPHLVVRDDAPKTLDPVALVRTKVEFEPVSQRLELDYTERSPQNDAICLRFLNFVLQGALDARPGLWQPSPGKPFFPRRPERVLDEAAQYRGFSARAQILPNGGIGLCIDIKHKYVSTRPLPRHISRDEFPSWKSRHCIYHYGHRWYQIQLAELSDYDVANHEVLSDGRWIPLQDFIFGACRKPFPPELANLPADTSVALYFNSRGEERSAPTLLCYPTYGTEDRIASRLHSRSVMAPHHRWKKIREFVRGYFSRLRLGDVEVQLSERLTAVPSRAFQVPDLEFGSGRVLSVRGTPDTQHIGLDRLGQARLALLQDEDAGFYEQEPFHRQYLVLPQTVVDSCGNRFKEDLCEAVNSLYHQEPGYDPEVLSYDDRGPRTYLHQGREILKAVDVGNQGPGYAVIMIHHTEDRKLREEDKLAALVVRELEPHIKAAIIHSDVVRECYEARWEGDEVQYEPRRYGKLRGYLRNVALNQVLLNNRLWPFILSTELHADLIIGIDLKNNIVGFTIVGQRGNRIWWTSKVSSQKQRMSERQVEAHMLEVLRNELRSYSYLPKTVVLHRDGRAFASELRGFRESIDQLRQEGLLDTSVALTVVEISKSAPVSLRLFEVTAHPRGRPWIDNPQIGRYYVVDDREGFLCTTGRPFVKRGTVDPLHVRRVYGSMPLELCLEDIFSLSCLTWTRPEDCTSLPDTFSSVRHHEADWYG